MRKEAMKEQAVTIATVNGYHDTTNYRNNEAYAFDGFKQLLYFNSDRPEATAMVNGVMVRANGEPMKGYGLETEVQCNGIRSRDALAEVFDSIILPKFKFGSKMFKKQRDGSLGGRSNLELISQVMTKARIRNDYAAYKTMYNVYFPAFDIDSDCYNTACGMHVNVSNGVFGKTANEIEDAIRKLAYFVNHNYDLCLRLFYRNPTNTGFCGRYSNMTDMDYCKTMDFTQFPNDHYKCINFSHYNAGRIELRIVGGQKNYFVFRNTMECVFWICERIGSVDWNDLDDFYKVFRGCNQYVYKRLSTECAAYIQPDVLDKINGTVKTQDFELK